LRISGTLAWKGLVLVILVFFVVSIVSTIAFNAAALGLRSSLA
jgi:hypothetical protein